MGAIKAEAEKYWDGELTTRQRHPLMPAGESEEVAPGVMFFRWFANLTAVNTAEGLVLIDTGAYFNQAATVEMVRRFSKARVNTAIYTHGHVDHACGMPAFIEEARTNNLARPRVVGHRATKDRFDRYRRTLGYNNTVNSRQFSRPSRFPETYVYPDTYFEEKFQVSAGDIKLECRHARGETDDHCWVYVPERKVLLTGDFIIWAVPNAGNPQKAQRYAREWAEALRAMARTGAEILLPGHGPAVFGRLHVLKILNDTADYIQSIYDQTLKLMNEGATLDEVIHNVTPPPELAGRPYLQAVYDEPEFMVRNIWRLEGGWYDGAPSHLKPARLSAQAKEIAALAGGVAPMVARALSRLETGELQLASHLIDWAAAAAPDDRAAHEARVRIYSARAAQADSTMAHGVFRAAALESAKKAGIAAPEDPRSF